LDADRGSILDADRQFLDRPLQYAPPRRSDTIPSNPISQALAKTTAPSASIASLTDRLGALDEPLELGSPVLEPLLANVLAVDLEEIEGDISGGRCAGVGAESFEVAAPVRPKDDGLAVNQDALDRRGTNGRGDPREPDP
jgi:hypothetical protein